MTAPIWIASPPEVHSALLSSGPGPESLLGAAGAWTSLSSEYSSAAEELSAILATAQAGAWEGPSAESYVAAHAPYLAWLTLASTISTAAAAQHETAAAAYGAAVAAMPTLAELAANHVIHGVLAATNFFGINTIPIALNEADYVRMWVQAATTMTAYQAVSSAAVVSTPQTTPAPQILNSGGQIEAAAASSPVQQIEQVFQQILQQIEEILSEPQLLGSQIFNRFLEAMGYSWDPANGTINGIPYLNYSNPLTLIYWITRALGYATDFQTFLKAFTTNPLAYLQSLAGVTPLQIVGYLALHPVLGIAIATSPLYSLSSAAPAVAAVASVVGLVDVTPPVAAATAAAPVVASVAAASHVTPSAVIGPTVAGSAPAPATAPVSAASAAGAPPSPSASPAPAAQGFFPYAIAAGPSIGFGSGHNRTGGVGAQLKAPEAGLAAAAAVSAARRRARRRKQTEVLREYADEYADLDPVIDPSAAAASSDRGAGPLGFAGTVSKESTQAAGLTVLAGNGFGGGPAQPMVPGTWDPDREPSEDV
jgi:PPE-repeat protein